MCGGEGTRYKLWCSRKGDGVIVKEELFEKVLEV